MNENDAKPDIRVHRPFPEADMPPTGGMTGRQGKDQGATTDDGARHIRVARHDDAEQALTGGADEADARRRFPELDSALANGTVTFDNVAAALFGGRGLLPENGAKDKAAFRRLLPLLRQGFYEANRRTEIRRLHQCKHLCAVIALTARPVPQVPWNWLPRNWRERCDLEALCDVNEPLELKKLASELDKVITDARRLLGFRQQRHSFERIYSVYATLLQALDDHATASSGGEKRASDPSQVLAFLGGLVDQTKQLVARAAMRKAQAHYMFGMAIGVVSLAILCAGAAWLVTGGPLASWIAKAGPLVTTLPILLGCLGVGGLGALLSVMARLSSSGLALDYSAGKTLTTVYGAFRPLVGGLFAAALYSFLISGLITIRPPLPDTEAFFYWSLAFLAGFTERWVPSMLARVETSVDPRMAGVPKQGSGKRSRSE